MFVSYMYAAWMCVHMHVDEPDVCTCSMHPRVKIMHQILVARLGSHRVLHAKLASNPAHSVDAGKKSLTISNSWWLFEIWRWVGVF